MRLDTLNAQEQTYANRLLHDADVRKRAMIDALDDLAQIIHDTRADIVRGKVDSDVMGEIPYGVADAPTAQIAEVVTRIVEIRSLARIVAAGGPIHA